MRPSFVQWSLLPDECIGLQLHFIRIEAIINHISIALLFGAGIQRFVQGVPSSFQLLLLREKREVVVVAQLSAYWDLAFGARGRGVIGKTAQGSSVSFSSDQIRTLVPAAALK